VTVAELATLPSAVVDLIEHRIAGHSRDLLLLVEEPRSTLLKNTFASLFPHGLSHDALARNLDALANSRLTVDSQSQAQVEMQMTGAVVAATFTDAALTADRTLFRSRFEVERAIRLFGYRPSRIAIFAPKDPAVPTLRSQGNGAGIVVWAHGVHPAVLRAFEIACHDLRTRITIVSENGGNGIFEIISLSDAGPLLASADVIVNLTDDPATAFALASFRKPLCSVSCGADEVIHRVQQFEPWSRLSIVDAILRAPAAGPALPNEDGLRRATILDSNTAHASVDAAPLVSIVMPTFSRPKTLRASLERLTQQTHPNIEIIVVNNAGMPVDDVVADFAGVRLINRSENTGNATRPRNDGIAQAKGDYIAIIDDDDVFFPDHIERMVRCLDRSGKDVAYSDFLVRFVERDGDGVERVFGWDLQKPTGITSFELLVMNRLGYLTIFARRSLFDRLGLFAEEVLGGEEVEYWLRIAQSMDFVHVDQPSTAYTVVRNWKGQLSEQSHRLYAGGYEKVYERYPADNFPLLLQTRAQYLASLRSTDTPAPMQPRYVTTR
jgi:glycosyltransferase involved in cell wall biosynthesis